MSCIFFSQYANTCGIDRPSITERRPLNLYIPHRHPDFLPRAFSAGIYSCFRSLDLFVPISSFILASVKKRLLLRTSPEFYRGLLEIDSSILKCPDPDVARCGLKILTLLSAELDEIFGMLSDGEVIQNLAKNLQSVEDLCFLEALADFATFGDEITRFYLAPVSAFERILQILDVQNDQMMVHVCKLISNWAAHSRNFDEALHEFVVNIDFETTLLTGNFLRKEKTVHAFHLMTTRFFTGQMLEIITPALFNAIIEMLTDCEIDSPLACDASRFLFLLATSREADPEFAEGAKGVMNDEQVRGRLELFAQSERCELSRPASLLLTRLGPVDTFDSD
jgi:hypothetical protein